MELGRVYEEDLKRTELGSSQGCVAGGAQTADKRESNHM